MWPPIEYSAPDFSSLNLILEEPKKNQNIWEMSVFLHNGLAIIPERTHKQNVLGKITKVGQ